MRATVVPPDPSWPERAHEEAERIARVLPGVLFIHHIGSTSVPALCAKPVIDLMPVVTDIAAVSAAEGALASLGYEAMGEFGLPGRRYFRKGRDQRSHHLHVYQVDHPDIARHLAFRDYLRAHPVQRDRYGALKERLAAEVDGDIERYMAGKDPFIKGLEPIASAWWRPVQVCAISGPVGVGKTTVMAAVGDLLRQAGVAHALVDRDALTEIWPRSPGDPFAAALGLANLGQLWRHARAAGGRCLVVAGVLETQSDVDALSLAIPDARVQVVRLRAPLDVLRARIAQREQGDGLSWHLARAAELARILEESGPPALTVDASDSADQVALRIMAGTRLLARLADSDLADR